MKTILLIEDDIVLRENTKELLELYDYNVNTAANGKLGLQAAIATLPDIIVCDIMMPELDGYGVLEGLSKQDSTMHIPFIFLSAKTERQDVRKGMDLGADDYITKPFSEDEIISAIESRLAKAAILKDRRNQQASKNDDNTDELRSLNDLKNFFDDNGDIFEFSKDEHIYTEGKNSNYIYLITKGIVKCHKLDENGKELTTALHKEDDLFGYTSFTQNIPYQETATTISDATLVGLSKNELKNILNTNHKLTLELIQLLTDDITGVKNQLLEMAYSSVYKKTATTILKFADKLNCKPDEAIKISRSDLASVAGIATETLIRTLSSFKKQGLIVIEGRNIRIVDVEKLKDVC
jgi:CheY-like chemotaxis protein/CRP-like cAMP-binding protein